MRNKVSNFWDLLLCFFFIALLTGNSQQQLPELEQTRLAAERGDPVAQRKLALTYVTLENYSTAYGWFQKAANRGDMDSQYQLARMLMEGRGKTSSSKVPVPKNIDAGLRWLLLVANQGHGSAQLDLAHYYEGGKIFNRDIVESYKWYKLIARGNFLGDTVYMNRLVMAMTHEQIQEGEKRAREWSPHQTTEEEFLEVIYVRHIELKGIAGSGGKRLAVINNEPLAKGQEAKILVGDKMLTVKCLEINEKSATVSIEGLRQPKEFCLK